MNPSANERPHAPSRWPLLRAILRKTLAIGGAGPEAAARVNARRDFLIHLHQVTRDAETGHRAFVDADGVYLGFVQLVMGSAQTVIIHRIWALRPGHGDGSRIMRIVCGLADEHGVVLRLKVIPIGRKPYPMQREHLLDWYQKHGFRGTRHNLTRTPVALKRRDGSAGDAT